MSLFRRKRTETARRKAERDLARTRAETPLYRALGHSLREMVEDNHLAEALTDALRGRR